MIYARILTLPKRVEQAEKLQQQLKNCGIEAKLFRSVNLRQDGISALLDADYIDSDDLPPVITGMTTNYPTWNNRANAYNAWKCHRQIMRNFIDTKEEFLLMLEDDAFIYEEEFKSQLDAFIKSKTLATVDMLYFGWYSNGHLFLDEKLSHNDQDIYRFIGGAGFHGVLLSRYAVKKLLNFPPIGPYDYIAGLLQSSTQLIAYAVYPSSIIQIDGFSFVEDGHLSKPKRDKI